MHVAKCNLMLTNFACPVELRDKMAQRYKMRVFDFVSQMSIKPAMLKDEFTEKYYEEDNPHNKELFNPNKAAILRNSSTQGAAANYSTITKMPKIHQNTSSSALSSGLVKKKHLVHLRNSNKNKLSDKSAYYLPKEDSV